MSTIRDLHTIAAAASGSEVLLLNHGPVVSRGHSGHESHKRYPLSRIRIIGTHLAQEVNNAVAKFALPVFKARTTQRVAYAEAGQSGLTVLSIEPHGKAAQEIDAITNELLNILPL